MEVWCEFRYWSNFVCNSGIIESSFGTLSTKNLLKQFFFYTNFSYNFCSRLDHFKRPLGIWEFCGVFLYRDSFTEFWESMQHRIYLRKFSGNFHRHRCGPILNTGSPNPLQTKYCGILESSLHLLFSFLFLFFYR